MGPPRPASAATPGSTALRRRDIAAFLRAQAAPITGTDLAERYGVSRQVIVQDMAVIRAAGEPLISSPRGYTLRPAALVPLRRATVAVQHTPEQTEDELLLLVDAGVMVEDVAIDHPLYGELRGMLMLRDRDDVAQFLTRMRASGAGLLLNLTQGVHVHTLAAPEEGALDAARAALGRRGYLL